MSKLNSNVEIPLPKCITILKAAIQESEYDQYRVNKKVFDLEEPADPVDLSGLSTADIQFLFDGRRRRQFRKPQPRVRHREFKINEFVDSSRAIIGSSGESKDSQHSRKVINSQEAQEIITVKPVVRGHRSRKREALPSDLEYQSSSDEQTKRRKQDGVKGKRGRPPKLKTEVKDSNRDDEMSQLLDEELKNVKLEAKKEEPNQLKVEDVVMKEEGKIIKDQDTRKQKTTQKQQKSSTSKSQTPAIKTENIKQTQSSIKSSKSTQKTAKTPLKSEQTQKSVKTPSKLNKREIDPANKRTKERTSSSNQSQPVRKPSPSSSSDSSVSGKKTYQKQKPHKNKSSSSSVKASKPKAKQQALKTK